jgi:hypothetical protein
VGREAESLPEPKSEWEPPAHSRLAYLSCRCGSSTGVLSSDTGFVWYNGKAVD